MARDTFDPDKFLAQTEYLDKAASAQENAFLYGVVYALGAVIAIYVAWRLLRMIVHTLSAEVAAGKQDGRARAEKRVTRAERKAAEIAHDEELRRKGAIL